MHFDFTQCKQKGQVLILVLIVILIIAAVAGGTYYLSRSTPPKASLPSSVVSQTPQSTPSTTDETANWKTYTNTKIGVSFKYPNEGKIKEGGSYGVDNVFLEDSNSIALLIDDGQMTISMEQTGENNLESFMADYKSFDGEIGFDYEGNKVEKVYIDGIQALKGAVAGPKSNRVLTLINNNKVYSISFEPLISTKGEQVLNSIRFLK